LSRKPHVLWQSNAETALGPFIVAFGDNCILRGFFMNLFARMARLGSVGLLSLSLMACVSGAPDAQNQTSKDPDSSDANFGLAENASQSARNLAADIAFLSSDAMLGRDTGTAQYDEAADFVAERYQSLGLKPMGDDGSYFQRVPLANIKRNLDTAKMSLTDDLGNSVTLTHLSDYVIGMPPNGVSMEVSAPVIFAGYGIDAPRFGYNDFEGLDVKGKIVITLAGSPLKMPSEERAHYSSRTSRAKMASDRGAVGLVTIYTAASEKRFPWDRMISFADRSRMQWLKDDGTTLNKAPNVKASATLSSAGAKMLFADAPTDWTAIEAEMEAGNRPKGFDIPLTMKISGSADYEEIESKNVVAVLEGSDPVLKNEYVVMSAHLDHIGISHRAKEGEDNINNGALDNATGIAVMLEEARLFSQSNERPRRSILFVAVTAEEKGLIGSDYFAINPTVPKGSMVANINLDMPIIRYDFTDVIAFGEQHSTMDKYIAKAAAEMGITVSPDPVPEMSLFVRSDHYSFVKQGVPSVFLFLGFGDGGEENFRDFMKTCYHRPCDEIDNGLDFEVGAKFARLNFLIARQVANSDERPQWLPGNFFGDVFGHKNSADH
jgi:peptidase M28-like protein